MPIPFVGRRFTPADFKVYLGDAKLKPNGFQPKFVTLHHMAIPSLADRPTGLSPQHLRNLLSYYQDQLGWSGAPHLFIDDRPDGIIVFQRLDARGVHAESFNSKAWGIEMLGHFDHESISDGRGAIVRDHAVAAMGMMCDYLKVSAETITFHRDDPKTKKTCPGLKVSKADIVARVKAYQTKGATVIVEEPDLAEWNIVLPGGVDYRPVHLKENRPMARIRHLLDLLRPGGKFAIRANRKFVDWTQASGSKHAIPVAEVGDDGAAWAFVRDIAEAAGRNISVADRTVSLS